MLCIEVALECIPAVGRVAQAEVLNGIKTVAAVKIVLQRVGILLINQLREEKVRRFLVHFINAVFAL